METRFRTAVDTAQPGFALGPGQRSTFLGSCFAAHVGKRMAGAGLDVHVNPFGVLYNPLSLASACLSMAGDTACGEECFFESDGLWHSWLHDSSFSAESLDGCRNRVETARRIEAERLPALDFLFLTLGTNRYYELCDGGLAVANCHKQPGRMFAERQLDVAGAERVLGQALDVLWRVNPKLQVVFTVSPYRYAKYGFHGNQLGKSVLLLAVDGLCRRHEGRCHYFPAYEILLDELRDYRFYAEDMLHPSDVAVAYIWERFTAACFTPEASAFAAEWEAVERAAAHRPLHPESEAHRDFLRQTMLKLDRLVGKYPNLASTPECERLRRLLKTD